MKNRSKLAILALWTALALPCATFAAAPASFTLIGPIEKFTLNEPDDSVCGGTVPKPLRSARMTVHGVDVLIPCNLIVQMPATYLTADDIFELNQKDPSKKESGLALADAKAPPLAAFEATVVGNVVDVAGKPAHVAGLVNISQSSLATGAGYIKSIDPVSRVILVGSDPGAPPSPQDARVRINDVTGVYDHKPFTTDVDTRFTVDTENPTIHALTGYPMCLPDGPGDADCPLSNRVVAGQTLRNFVMSSVPLPGSPADALPIAACPACDPTRQAPFMPGDAITYSGTLARDGMGLYVSAHTIVANVGIFTRPLDTSKPAWVSIETSLVGTMGPLTQRTPPTPPPNDTLPQETQDRLKIEGFTTDPARNVEIYAIDVDPVSGARILRLLNTVRPQSVPFGRFRLIVGKRAGVLFDRNGTVKGATRELMVHVQNPGSATLDGKPVPTGPKVAHGLVAGQYVAPVGELIFPENTVLGDPLVPNNFECVAFLQLGSGPLTTNGHSGPVVPRLAPWPGPVAAPGPLNCSL